MYPTDIKPRTRTMSQLFAWCKERFHEKDSTLDPRTIRNEVDARLRSLLSRPYGSHHRPKISITEVSADTHHPGNPVPLGYQFGIMQAGRKYPSVRIYMSYTEPTPLP